MTKVTSKMVLTLGVLVVLIVSGASCAAATTSAQTTDSTSHAASFHKIVCIGDSITWGLYESPTYPELLQARLNTVSSGWTVINEGISGDPTGHMLARLQNDVVKWEKPQYVMIMGGGNDPSAAATESNIDAMCKLAVANGITPILMTMIPMYEIFHEQRSAEVNTWLSSYAAANGYPLIDTYTPLNDPSNPGNLLPAYVHHNVHPNALGFTALVNSIDLAVFGLDQTTGASGGCALPMTPSPNAAAPTQPETGTFVI
jgi:lysophospholipase L1-like esterase